jgi:hypothetical protein
MLLRRLIRWGAWPARLAGLALVMYGAYLLITAQMLMAGPTDTLTEGDPYFSAYLQFMIGVGLIGCGGLVAGLSWLTRRRHRTAAIGGVVGCFFLAGLAGVYALTGSLFDAPSTAALIAGVCLLIAGGTALAGRKVFDREVQPHD